MPLNPLRRPDASEAVRPRPGVLFFVKAEGVPDRRREVHLAPHSPALAFSVFSARAIATLIRSHRKYARRRRLGAPAVTVSKPQVDIIKFINATGDSQTGALLR